MANQKRTTPRERKPVSPPKPPAQKRATPAPKKKDPFAGVGDLAKHDAKRRNIFR